MKSTNDIETALAYCTGTENYYAHPLSRLVFTDGIKTLAEMAGAYWLVDIVASYQGDRKMRAACGSFQLWELTVDLKEQTAVVTCKADSDAPVLVRQVIEYTDFPLAFVKLYVESSDRTVLLLPSEH